MRAVLLACVLIAAFLLVAECTQQPASPVRTVTPVGNVPAAITADVSIPAIKAIGAAATMDSWKRVRLSTSMGDIVIALDPAMPITTGNFATLVKKGYYNSVIFHRVIPGFILQGGDPTGTGCGGPGYIIKDEFGTNNQNNRGTIAMANAGPNTGGSQFFINLVNNDYLNTKHPVFGRVVEGMDVVDKIAKEPTSGGQVNRPLQNVTIVKAVMI